MFKIYNVNAGEDLGTYAAENEDAALNAMAQSFGYADYADCVRDYGISIEDAKRELEITRVSRPNPHPEGARFSNPEHWRERAEKARVLAEAMSDAWARQAMLRVADDYEKLEARAIARQREATQ